MTQNELQAILDDLRRLPDETECVEFKEAKNDYHFDRLGEYFSALSNEANLKSKARAWLIFGVSDKPPRPVVGSSYRANRAALDSLKLEVANQTSNCLTFVEIHELATPHGRVVLFEIPPASRGVPTSWKGHWFGRDGHALVPLGLHELESIRKQATREDWSAGVVADATFADLDPAAIAFARKQYKTKAPRLAAEVDGWDDTTFLNKSKVCVGGKVTRTALILLGKDESEHYLSPAVARITWLLKDAPGTGKDYEHFGPPLILAVDQVFAHIRNLTIRSLANTSLFPTEVTQYDPWVIREALHNCIAHQDYTLGGRINVVETDDELLFTSLGGFLPRTVEDVIRADAPMEFYRNRFLSQAMFNLNMIDTIGSGVKRMFTTQRARNFPLPDYDLSESGRVKVRVSGKVIDEKYTRMLLARTDLDLFDVIALDKVQKGRSLTDEEFKSLRDQKLVEGKRKNPFVSATIAAATDTKADYIKHRAFDKDHYKRLVEEYLRTYHEANREDFDRLLRDKLSDALTEDQKTHFVKNLIQELRGEGVIVKRGARTGLKARWVLSSPSSRPPT